MTTLPSEFYARPVVEVARDLLGCTLEHGGAMGVIVETEAYHECEPACHAFAGLTPRTRTLFERPGLAYVYRSYGIHALVNAVCEGEGVGAAVLIRALQPLAGVAAMRERRGRLAGRPPREQDLCSGPGKLAQALAISLAANGCDLSRGPIRIAARTAEWLDPPVVSGTRIGITRALELPWRFCVAGNPHVSRPRPDSFVDARPGRGRRVRDDPQPTGARTAGVRVAGARADAAGLASPPARHRP
jgi:DNA-3-methyladenine glycosylase